MTGSKQASHSPGVGSARDIEATASALVASSCGKNTNLAAPTETKDADMVVDGRVAGSKLLAETNQGLGILDRVGLGREEVAEGLFLLGGVVGQPLLLGAVTVKKVGYEDEGASQRGEEIGTLKSLGPHAKNIVYSDNGLGGIFGANNV